MNVNVFPCRTFGRGRFNWSYRCGCNSVTTQTTTVLVARWIAWQMAAPPLVIASQSKILTFERNLGWPAQTTCGV